MPSPQTPLPERARGFENLQLFLAPLLLLWEKGLGDEGKRFVSQSGDDVKTILITLLTRGCLIQKNNPIQENYLSLGNVASALFVVNKRDERQYSPSLAVIGSAFPFWML
jgi:hypothetical protein